MGLSLANPSPSIVLILVPEALCWMRVPWVCRWPSVLINALAAIVPDTDLHTAHGISYHHSLSYQMTRKDMLLRKNVFNWSRSTPHVICKNAKCCPSSAATHQAKSHRTQLPDLKFSNFSVTKVPEICWAQFKYRVLMYRVWTMLLLSKGWTK